MITLVSPAGLMIGHKSYSQYKEEHPMKITSFNPLIVTKDTETTIALFEELGFESRHTKEGISKKM